MKIHETKYDIGDKLWRHHVSADIGPKQITIYTHLFHVQIDSIKIRLNKKIREVLYEAFEVGQKIDPMQRGRSLSTLYESEFFLTKKEALEAANECGDAIRAGYANREVKRTLKE